MLFNKSDQKVLIALCSLAVIAMAVMFIFGGNIKISFSKTGDLGESTMTDKQQKYFTRHSDQEKYKNTGYYDNIEPSQLRLVPFDPNTANAATLEGLGLARWQVKSILKYRAKGGEYRTPEDFARVYKLTVKQYKRIRPYIRISNDYRPASDLLNGNENIVDNNEDAYKQYAKVGKGEYITLNVADTSMLRKVPGIGPYFAGEIFRYGKRLGGYVDIEQLSEISNFPEDAKQYFQIDLSKVKKLSVNGLSLEKLRAHPYINYYQARAIVDYRHKYGKIKSLDELKLSPYFTEDDIKRIKPYVEF